MTCAMKIMIRNPRKISQMKLINSPKTSENVKVLLHIRPGMIIPGKRSIHASSQSRMIRFCLCVPHVAGKCHVSIWESVMLNDMFKEVTIRKLQRTWHSSHNYHLFQLMIR